MKCERVRGLLAELVLDGEHCGGSSAEFGHIRACADCSAALERERSVVALLRTWSEPEVKDAERDRLRMAVRAAILAEPSGVGGSSSARRVAAAASIAAVALLLGLAALGRIGGPTNGAAIAGPATRADEKGPGVFTMVGPFSEKERVETKRSADRPRRVEPRQRRGIRKASQVQKSVSPPCCDQGTVDSDSMMRFEFQTADPAIRIIWFVPRADDMTEQTGDIGD